MRLMLLFGQKLEFSGGRREMEAVIKVWDFNGSSDPKTCMLELAIAWRLWRLVT